jgi:hypothetical protein
MLLQEKLHVPPAVKHPAIKHPVHTQLAQVSNFVCEDDKVWRDAHGNGCNVYKRTIKHWGEEKVCKKHLGGVGAIHCRRTCGSCTSNNHDIEDKSPGCADNACIAPWQKAYGRCYQCVDFRKGCTEPRFKAVFEAECPVTCGLCKAVTTTAMVDRQAVKSEKEKAACVDEDHVFCQNLGMSYCSEEKFTLKCPQTCEMCPTKNTVVGACLDMFEGFTCSRYASYGWCDREDTKASVRLHCANTCGQCGILSTTPELGPRDHLQRSWWGGSDSTSPAITIALLIGLVISQA